MTPTDILEMADFDHAIYLAHIETMERHAFDFRAVWIAAAGYMMLQDWQERGRPIVAAADEVVEDEAIIEIGSEDEDWNALGEKADDAYDEYRLVRGRWQS